MNKIICVIIILTASALANAQAFVVSVRSGTIYNGSGEPVKGPALGNSMTKSIFSISSLTVLLVAFSSISASRADH
jgi:hypothetical protein